MADISYEPIIKEMTWSYSRVKAFDMCPYGWYLKYIHKIRGKDMFFSSYGSFCHKLLEEYYKGELAKHQLLYRYLTDFRENVKARAPSPAIFKSYFQNGLDYFRNFEPVPYKICGIEEKIEGEIEGVKFTGVIDCRAEDDSGTIILDNKSRKLKPRSGKKRPTKTDEELDQYLVQLYLYGRMVSERYQTPISCLGFNCFRCNPPLIIEPYVQEKSDLAVKWLTDNVSRITKETEFCPDMDYFKCKNLCDVHDHCEYYQMTWGDEK